MTEKGGNVTEEQVEKLRELALLVERQSWDEGLWFVARTAPEGYLQEKLRDLHRAVEAVVPDLLQEEDG